MSSTLFYNAVFHSGISEEDEFSYMAVEKGIITGTWKKRPADLRFEKEIDLRGKHVYPCLIDGHMHMLFTIAVAAMGFDACEITPEGVRPDTMDGIEEKIRAFAAGCPKNAVIAASNFIITAVKECRLPSREELDDWAGGRAIVIYSIDGHSSALSSKMLEKLGIGPEGHSGILSGEAHERNQGKLTDIISASITLPVLARGIAKFQNTCAEYGISVVGALEGNGDSPKDPTTALIVRLARHFDVGVRFYFQYMDVDRAEKLSRFQKHKRIGGCGDWEMDGSVGSHSAAFALPYSDTGEAAECYYSQEQVDKAVTEAGSRGFQVASHAIGDRAIARIAESFNAVDGSIYNRIEHCEFITDETLSKLDGEKYAVMMQPGYAWIDKRYLHTYESFLPERIIRGMKLRSIGEKVRLCASSDSPVQSMDPYLQMRGMTEFYNPEESVSAFEAFRAYTANPAAALLEEGERGTLEPGKAADFFTADGNLFTMTPEEISGFRPDECLYGGKKYRKKSGTVAELLLSLLTPPKKV